MEKTFKRLNEEEIDRTINFVFTHLEYFLSNEESNLSILDKKIKISECLDIKIFNYDDVTLREFISLQAIDVSTSISLDMSNLDDIGNVLAAIDEQIELLEERKGPL